MRPGPKLLVKTVHKKDFYYSPRDGNKQNNRREQKNTHRTQSRKTEPAEKTAPTMKNLGSGNEMMVAAFSMSPVNYVRI